MMRGLGTKFYEEWLKELSNFSLVKAMWGYGSHLELSEGLSCKRKEGHTFCVS